MTVSSLAAVATSNMPIELPNIRYRYYVLAIMLFTYMMSYIDRTIVGILAPLIKADLHLNDAELGLANGTAFAASFACLTVPFGWLADRWNRIRIVNSALVFFSACTALFGAGHTLGQLVLARVGVGAGEAGTTSSVHSLLTDYFPRAQRARAMAIYGFGGPLGVAVGSIVGGLASVQLGWRMTFVLMGVLGCGLALLMRLTVDEPKRIVLEGEPHMPERFWRSVWLMLCKPGYVPLCLGATCGSIAGFVEYFWIPSFIGRSFHLSVAEVSVKFGVISIISGISGAWVGGWISDRLTHRTPAAPALVTAGSYLAALPVMLGMLFSQNPSQMWVFLILLLFFASFGIGPIVAATQNLATPALRGTASSVMTFVLVLVSMGVGVPLVGALSDFLAPRFGSESLRYALLFIPLTYFIGAVFFLISGRKMSMIKKTTEDD